ncbi:hypothetical protein Hanom_Chr07g00633891 [Helianthus anomalus]
MKTCVSTYPTELNVTYISIAIGSKYKVNHIYTVLYVTRLKHRKRNTCNRKVDT